jgi:hypothetical protein
LMLKTASTTLMGIALGLPCFKLAVWEEPDSGASWDWSNAPCSNQCKYVQSGLKQKKPKNSY